MQLDEVPGDRQAQPEAIMGSPGRAVRLSKRFEHIRQKRRIDPWPIVFDGNTDVVACKRRVDPYEPALAPEAQRRVTPRSYLDNFKYRPVEEEA